MNQPAFLFGSYNAAATVTASSTATGLDANDILEPTEDYYWTPTGLTTESVVIDTVTPTTRDCWALLGQGLDGVTLEIRGSTDNFSASDVELLGATQIYAPVNAAWGAMTSGSYRYLKFIFNNIGSNFRLAHAWAQALTLLPFLEDDWDQDTVQVSGEHLVSQDGRYLGSAQRNAMREFSLNWGEIPQTDYVNLAAWATECIATLRGSFFVPDTANKSTAVDGECVHFGWSDKRFSAPYRLGFRKVDTINFTTRAR